jgi:hypothetical protein
MKFKRFDNAKTVVAAIELAQKLRESQFILHRLVT